MLAATGLFFDPGWPRWLCGGKSIAPELRAGRVTEAAWTPRHVFAASLLGLFFGVQILLPFRHHLYPGDVNWTEEGHLFSWHMKLRDKRVVEAEFVLRNGSGDTLRVVEARKILPRWMRNRVMSRPDLVHQLAIALAEHERRRGHRDVRVHALVRGSLNGRAPQLLVDPDVDLAAQPRNLRPAAWILPLRDPTLQGRARSASGSGEQHEGE
jgi:hypothetical protein